MFHLEKPMRRAVLEVPWAQSLGGWAAAVALEGPQVAEAAAAVLAAVGRGPAVNPLVGVQVPQLLEATAALRAGVRTLT